MATVEAEQEPALRWPGRVAKAVEAAIVDAGREGVSPALTWLAAGLGKTLPLMPLLRTTYVGFLYTCAVAAWMVWRGERLADFGFAWPRRWVRALLWGVGFFLLVLLYAVTLQPLVDAQLVAWFGPNRGAETFHALRGDLGTFLIILPSIWLFAAVGEEFLYRGYLLTRLIQIFGEGRLGLAAAMIVQAVLFGLGHLYQGPAGAIGVAIYGLFYAFAARVMKETILPAMIVHGLLDTLAFTMLYLGAL